MGKTCFEYAMQRVTGRLTLPLISREVPGHMTLHNNTPSCAEGWWATMAKIVNGDVLCTSSDGGAIICHSEEEVEKAMVEMYARAEMAARNRSSYYKGTITDDQIKQLKAALLQENSHIATMGRKNGNLLVFTGFCNCAHPERSKWCEVSMIVNGAAICSASNGDTEVCYTLDEVHDFVNVHI